MLKRLGKWVGGFVIVVLIAVAAMFFATRGDYPVPATVIDDPDLPSFTVSGVQLHLETYGSSEDPVIIVLHGGPGGDFRSLLPLRSLSDRYFMVFYDQRGAGLSERVEAAALTLDDHLDELAAIAAHFSPDGPVTLIGHSWGAMLASAFLGQMPDRVDRAVLIEPGFLSAEEADAFLVHLQGVLRAPSVLWEMVLTGFRAAHVDGPDAFASDDFLIGHMTHVFAAHPDTGYTCAGETWDSPAWRSGALAGSAVQEAASRADLDRLGQVAGFSGPVLLVSGGCSGFIGAVLQEAHLRLFAQARHAVVLDAGHDVIDDQPQAALALIGTFLSE